MKLPTAGRILRILGLTFFLLISFVYIVRTNTVTPITVYAAGPVMSDPTGAPTSNAATWAFDPEVTEVGKNSERARQLLWWVFSHPGVHTSPVLAQIWSFSLKIVYVFVIVMIVALGIGLILSSRKGSVGAVFSGISNPVAGISLPSIFVKIATVLVYVTFSYVIVLALIQVSDISMRFFIENVGGRDLFNVVFAGAGNKEENYLTFVGYSDTNPLNHEMVNTSLFLIRFTSLTYFVMAIIMVLRTVILWFLLVMSPFLGLLTPFIFIRNVGWIWIGVFFQWLFYGPLVALFLAAITKIWLFGIPYAFDFSKVRQPTGQVYRTAINILYGGPAQTISPGNSANYVDTYAEYIISLVMLWTAIILPWLLLRIFRDYCCAGIAAAGATLGGIFDRLRQYPMPPPPTPAPTVTTGLTLELPFRQKVKEEIHVTKETNIENIREITRETTHEIVRNMDMSVSSLADVSRFEMDQTKRSNALGQFGKLAAPHTASTSSEREKYSILRSELQQRAAHGDVLAKSMLTASDNKTETIIANIPIGSSSRPMIATPSKTAGVYAPTTTVAMQNQKGVASIPSKNAGVYAPTTTVTMQDQKGIPSVTPTQTRVQTGVTTMNIPVGSKKVATQVAVEDYEEVKKMWLKHYREAPAPANIERSSWLSEEIKKLSNISNLLASSDPKLKQKGLESVAEILPFLLLGGFSDVETLAYLKAKQEAANQIETELGILSKAKEEAKKEIKDEEETLLEVGEKKTEEKKQATLEATEKMELGGDEKQSVAEDKSKDTKSKD